VGYTAGKAWTRSGPFSFPLAALKAVNASPAPPLGWALPTVNSEEPEKVLREERHAKKNRCQADKAYKSILRIDDIEYGIEDVAFSAHHHERDGEHFLEVNVFADTKEMSQAGFALNCLTFAGLQRIENLQRKTFSLGTDGDDDLNELGESVICKPGKVLEIDALRLKFGRLADSRMPVKMDAVCHGDGQTEIEVSGSFQTLVK